MHKEGSVFVVFRKPNNCGIDSPLFLDSIASALVWCKFLQNYVCLIEINWIEFSKSIKHKYFECDGHRRSLGIF